MKIKRKDKERAPKTRVVLEMTEAEARKLAAALEISYWDAHGAENEKFLEETHAAIGTAVGAGFIGHTSGGFKRAYVR